VAVRWAPWGPKKCMRKEAILQKNEDFCEVVQFPGFVVLVSFSKMDFRRRPFNQKPVVFGKSPRVHLRSKDHLVMKGLSKNVKNHEF